MLRLMENGPQRSVPDVRGRRRRIRAQDVLILTHHLIDLRFGDFGHPDGRLRRAAEKVRAIQRDPDDATDQCEQKQEHPHDHQRLVRPDDPARQEERPEHRFHHQHDDGEESEDSVDRHNDLDPGTWAPRRRERVRSRVSGHVTVVSVMATVAPASNERGSSITIIVRSMPMTLPRMSGTRWKPSLAYNGWWISRHSRNRRVRPARSA